MARVQDRALHAADPRVRLILAGTGGTDLPFLDAVLRALGGQRACDLAGAHPYRFPAAAARRGAHDRASRRGSEALDWAGELSATEALFGAHGYGRPRTWLTEFGWPAAAVPPGPTTSTTPRRRRADLRAAHGALRSDPRLRFVQAAFWFNLRDYAPGHQNPDPEFFGHYGLLENAFARKPAASAFLRLARGA